MAIPWRSIFTIVLGHTASNWGELHAEPTAAHLFTFFSKDDILYRP
jgi:hypothetical protein